MKPDLGQDFLSVEGRQCILETIIEGRPEGKRVITTEQVGVVIDAANGKMINLDELLEDDVLVFLMPIN